jgi:hypothetical protein
VNLPERYIRCAAMPEPCAAPAGLPADVRSTAPSAVRASWVDGGMAAYTNRQLAMGYAPGNSLSPFGWYTPPVEARRHIEGPLYSYIWFRFVGSRSFSPTHARVYGPAGDSRPGFLVPLLQVEASGGAIYYMLPLDEMLEVVCSDPSMNLSFHLVDMTMPVNADRYLMLTPEMFSRQGLDSRGQIRPAVVVDCPVDGLCFGVEPRAAGSCLTFGSVREARPAGWQRAPQMCATPVVDASRRDDGPMAEYRTNK